MKGVSTPLPAAASIILGNSLPPRAACLPAIQPPATDRHNGDSDVHHLACILLLLIHTAAAAMLNLKKKLSALVPSEVS